MCRQRTVGLRGGGDCCRAPDTYCLPTAAHAASVWLGCAGKVRSSGRHSGSVAVIVADMYPSGVYVKCPTGAAPYASSSRAVPFEVML